MADSNLYVLEVRHGVILYLNEQTEVRDGWWWGTDEQFVAGPFKSSELAIADARRHTGRPLELIILTTDNFDAADEPSSSGNLIVVDTGGEIWMREWKAAGSRP